MNAEKIAHKFDTVNDTNQGRQSEVLVERPNGLRFSRRLWALTGSTTLNKIAAI